MQRENLERDSARAREGGRGRGKGKEGMQEGWGKEDGKGEGKGAGEDGLGESLRPPSRAPPPRPLGLLLPLPPEAGDQGRGARGTDLQPGHAVSLNRAARTYFKRACSVQAALRCAVGCLGLALDRLFAAADSNRVIMHTSESDGVVAAIGRRTSRQRRIRCPQHTWTSRPGGNYTMLYYTILDYTILY